MRLNDNGSWFDSVIFQFQAAEERVPQAGLKDIQEVLPHLAKAFDVGRSFRQLKSRFQAVLTVLDNVHVGLVVLRHDGEALVVNSSAQRLLESRDAVEIDAFGRLRFRDDKTNREFALAVSQVAMTADGRGKSNTVTLNAKRRAGALPLLVEITPLRDSSNELGDSVHGVSVLLLDPTMGARIRTDRMAKWALLTDAESKVCRHLVDGLTNNAIAEQRSTSLETVKSQVKSVLSKCQARSRTELVRIALQSSPPIGYPP